MSKTANNNNELPIKVINDFDKDLIRWGYKSYPDVIKEWVDYSEDLYKNWNSSSTFSGDKNLVIAPKINTRGRTSLENLFYGCSNLREVHNKLNTEECTNISGLFRGCSSLTAIPQLDTSNVTNIRDCFYGCGITTVPELNLKKCTDLSGAFGSTNLIEFPNINIDYSSVQNLNHTFAYTEITSTPSLNTENCIDFRRCFSGCDKLKRIEGLSFKGINSDDCWDREGYENSPYWTGIFGTGLYDSSSKVYRVESYNVSCDYLLIKDIGFNPKSTEIPLGDINGWADTVEGEQSLIDSLLTYSFDRRAAGYRDCTIYLGEYVYPIVQYYEELVSAIESKGYRLVKTFIKRNY